MSGKEAGSVMAGEPSALNGNAGGAGKFLLVAAVGLVGVLAVWFNIPHLRFWVNWIYWLLMIITIGVGAMFVASLEHLVGARWSVPLRRVPERLSSLALLAIPVALIALFSLPIIYPWAQAGGPAAYLGGPVSEIVKRKEVWLNPTFFSIRVVGCLLLWGISYRILVGGSIRQDHTRDPRITKRARHFAPAFMAIVAFTLTVVAFDWISSLEPEWYSDIFGVYVFVGSFLAGLSATSLVVVYMKNRGRLPGIRFDHLYSLGAFIFAFIVFWSYIAFAQYLLIWYANLPEEVTFYKHRMEGAWKPVALGLAIFHFLVPFFAVICRDVKGNPRRLFWIATLVLFAHALDLYWLVFPHLGDTPSLGWPELSFAVFFLGLGMWWVRRSMGLGADMPIGDPFLKEGLEFRL